MVKNDGTYFQRTVDSKYYPPKIEKMVWMDIEFFCAPEIYNDFLSDPQKTVQNNERFVVTHKNTGMTVPDSNRDTVKESIKAAELALEFYGLDRVIKVTNKEEAKYK